MHMLVIFSCGCLDILSRCYILSVWANWLGEKVFCSSQDIISADHLQNEL